MRTTAASSPSTNLLGWSLRNLQSMGSTLFAAWATFSLATRALTFQVSDSTNSNDINPTLTATNTGSAALWQRLNGNWDIFGSLLNINGPVGPNVLINTNNTLGDQTRPDIKFYPLTGELIACWEEAGTSLTIARLDANLQATKTIVGADTTPGIEKRNPKLAVLDNGNYSLVWEQKNGTTWTVWQQDFDASDNRVGGAFRVSDTGSDEMTNPSVSSNGATVSVVYETHNQQKINTTGYTPIGDMDRAVNGGLASAFDGVTDTINTYSAAKYPGSYDAHIGINFSPDLYTVTGVKLWGSNNDGYNDQNPLINISLRASNSIPNATLEGSNLAWLVYQQLDTSNSNQITKLKDIASNYFQNFWVALTSDPTITSYVWWGVVELEFYETKHSLNTYNGSHALIGSSTVTTYQNPFQSQSLIAFDRFNPKNQTNLIYALTSQGEKLISNSDGYRPKITHNGNRALLQWQTGNTNSNNPQITAQFLDSNNDEKIGPEFTVSSNGLNAQIISQPGNQFFSIWQTNGKINAKYLNANLAINAPSSIDFEKGKQTPLNITVDPTNFLNTLEIRITLSNPNAGQLSTATSGSVTSIFDSQTGIWSAAGLTTDVISLLPNTQFRALDSTDLTLTVEGTDGLNRVINQIALSHKLNTLSTSSKDPLVIAGGIVAAAVIAICCAALSLSMVAMAGIFLGLLVIRNKRNNTNTTKNQAPSVYGNTALVNEHLKNSVEQPQNSITPLPASPTYQGLEAVRNTMSPSQDYDPTESTTTAKKPNLWSSKNEQSDLTQSGFYQAVNHYTHGTV